jgi:hypothetical protein
MILNSVQVWTSPDALAIVASPTNLVQFAMVPVEASSPHGVLLMALKTFLTVAKTSKVPTHSPVAGTLSLSPRALHHSHLMFCGLGTSLPPPPFVSLPSLTPATPRHPAALATRGSPPSGPPFCRPSPNYCPPSTCCGHHRWRLSLTATTPHGGCWRCPVRSSRPPQGSPSTRL